MEINEELSTWYLFKHTDIYVHLSYVSRAASNPEQTDSELNVWRLSYPQVLKLSFASIR